MRKFYGCKRFNSLLPLTHDRKEQAMPFQVIATDFASPTYYRAKIKTESKVYNLLFSCSVSRAVHLKIIPYKTTQKFLRCLKQVVGPK